MPNRDTLPKSSAALPESNSESYKVFLSGGLFTQHDLSTNVFLKESVWRLSNGRFELVLPQSKELRQLDRPDLAAYIRNTDLHQLVQADIIIARFDGQELDTGTIVEFMVTKMLGKPTVILRTDSRHLTSGGLDDPYNLMVKNWPRTVEVFIDSHIDYVHMLAESVETFRDRKPRKPDLEIELDAIRKGIDAMAAKVIEALNSVLEMDSPYPPELREVVYEAVSYVPGAGFAQLLTRNHLEAILQKLKDHNTL